MGFLDELYQEHGASVQNRITTELGIPADKAAMALPTVAPIILAGLKRQMDQHGPAHVEQSMSDMNQNGIPDDEEVGGLLGGKGKEASALMANQLGISGEAAGKLIPMLAPIIIGMLMKKGGQAGAGGGGAAGGQSPCQLAALEALKNPYPIKPPSHSNPTHPTDSALPTPAASSHAYKFPSSSHHGVPVASAPSGYPSPVPVDASRRNGAAHGASPSS